MRLHSLVNNDNLIVQHLEFLKVRILYLMIFSFLGDVGSHVENAHAATGQGKSQLVKAAKTQKANSSLVTLYCHPSAFILDANVQDRL